MIQGLSADDSLETLYCAVCELTGGHPDELQFPMGADILPKVCGTTLQFVGISSQSVLTAIRCKHPRILWRGFQIKRAFGFSGVRIRERQERLLHGSDDTCLIVGVERQNEGDYMDDSIQEGSDILQWDIMQGTYHRTSVDSVDCRWEKHFQRIIGNAGLRRYLCDEDYDSEWQEVRTQTSLETLDGPRRT